MLLVKVLKEKLRTRWTRGKTSKHPVHADPDLAVPVQGSSSCTQKSSSVESRIHSQQSAPSISIQRTRRKKGYHWIKRAYTKIKKFAPSSSSPPREVQKQSRTSTFKDAYDQDAIKSIDNNINSLIDSNTTIDNDSLERSDCEDLDLRYFYDPRSEDPINRMVFVAGPEHLYHLALQLETSPRIEYQLHSRDLYIRSAGLGYALAQFKLGICYERGQIHFPMDALHSFAWYKRAAMQGHADAELAISGWYLTGHESGLIQSESLAYEWAAKAARRGWSKAEYTLAHYHEVGIGVPQDLQVAKQWYLKAAARGDERAMLRLLVGNVGLDVDYVHLKDALLAENGDNPYLIHQLAQLHEPQEYGLVPDEEVAFELYAASAQANYAPAQHRLGECYEYGNLQCPQDPTQAVYWYRHSAENGHVESQLALTGFYLDGSVGQEAEQSDEEVFRLVKAAAQRGLPRAEYMTGHFLEYGWGVERDMREAKQWYRLACAKGVGSAELRLKELEKATASGTGAT
ncbi:hypothetical protein BG011_001652 [Mortierella polycephala]|uniref:HCP-like protein n=1 Tax=Mortierella polycephala TaxID=41804 RepID=A0A9P6Q6T0_9FUNG|nr:hypothetical protein BG011_001652 [Mortierella polycephala]